MDVTQIRNRPGSICRTEVICRSKCCADALDISISWIDVYKRQELDDEVIKEHLHPDYPGIWLPTDEWDQDYSHDRCWS